jgi:glutathione S-transferase
VKLYSNRFAPSPRRVRMFAAEKGIALDVVEVDIAAGEHRSAEFLARNPRGELPLLELDDGSILTESLAICRLLEARHPEPNLWGRTQEERAAVDCAVDGLMFRLYVPTTQAFRHGHEFWAGRIEQVPAYADVARRLVTAEYDILERRLADHEYVSLDRFTMADIVAYTTVEFGKVAGLRPGADHKGIQRWRAAIGERPSARA